MQQISKADVLIVGAGHAGAQCAIFLRQQKFEGSIAVVGLEPELPYHRPPLSKEYLAKETTFERIAIRPAVFWEGKQVEFILGQAVTEIDAQRKIAKLSNDQEISYGSLVWAAGGQPRRLSCNGAELEGVHSVRTRADIDLIVQELDAGARHVAIIGGGYIGLEAAAVLTKLSCKVTVLEAQSRVLARVAGEALSTFYEAQHRAHGVDVRTNVIVDELVGKNGRLSGVTLASGEVISADIAIVGIGIIPTIAPLQAAGAKCGNGVEVDEFCQTSLPDVYAIGDCAAHVNTFAQNNVIRLESVQNANDQAATVAKMICGNPLAYRSTPWFWSNQYDLKLQTVGLSSNYDQIVLRGDQQAKAFSVVYLRDGKVIALDCVNSPRDFVQGRKVVESGLNIDVEALADMNIPLISLLN